VGGAALGGATEGTPGAAVETPVVVDRIEGDEGEYTLLEYREGETFDLPSSLAPTGTREGDRLMIRVSKAGG
jgi:hypothetical protein